jgi:hypothetical protein
VVFGQVGEEEVTATDGSGKVRVGAAAEGREGGDGGAIGVEEEPEEWGRVELAEVVAEGTRGANNAEEGTAGEHNANEAPEGGETEQDFIKDVIVEVGYDGGGGRVPE